MPFSKTGLPHSFNCLERKKITTQGSFICDHVYVFHSASNLKYIVNIHQYKFGICAVKFNLKRHSKQPNKYKFLANQPDKIKILKTIVAIMVEFTEKVDVTASFAFIGMSSQDEAMESTKRFRVYKALSQRYFKIENYEHAEDPKKSLYMILNKKKNTSKLYTELVSCIENEMIAEFSNSAINPFTSSTSRNN